MSDERLRRFRQRANRRLYRLLYTVYRAVFRTGPARRLRPEELRRVLIIRNDAVGDLVVTTPVLSFLADVAPQAQVDVLASPTNTSLIAGDKRVNHCYVSPTTRSGWMALLRELRGRRYDVIYSLRYGKALREGLISGFAATRATQKVSVFRPKRYHGLFTQVVRTPQNATHMTEHLLYVVGASLELDAGYGEPSLLRYPMRLAIGAEAEGLAGEFLRRNAVRDFVVVNFSAREPERDWPPASCARVIRELARRHDDLTFVVTGPAARGNDTASIVAGCGGERVVAFPPSSDLLVLAALIRRSRLVVTPDTAAVHIASATKRPVVGLYLPLRTHLWVPYRVPARIVQAPPGAPIAGIPESAIVDAFEELHAETAVGASSR